MNDKTTDSQTRTVTPIAIVGAGPVGLSLALGLARHGVRSLLIERKAGTSEYSKAPGIHLRTREIFQLWGIEERVLAAGVLRQTIPQLGALDFTELEPEADRPGLLIVEQAETERLLLEALRHTGLCDLRFDAEVVGLAQGSDRVTLTVRETGADRAVQAQFVVGCDGAGSFVRAALGLPFVGMTYSLRPMLSDVRVKDERDALPWPRYRNAREGLSFTARLRPGLWRIVRLERGVPAKEDVPDEAVCERARELLGPGPVEVVWASRFRIHLRTSPRFRVGRVLLAGDAAHVHSPVGGQGMNAGIQDAGNLAWKLASALQGGDPDRLLDSYDVERRAVVVERISRFTDMMTRAFLQTPVLLRTAAFGLLRLLLMMRPVRRRIVRRLAMVDLAYPASPLLNPAERAAGWRLPNPTLVSSEGSGVRLYHLLPVGPVILDVAERRPFASDLPLPDVIRVGPSGWRDPTGSIRALLGGHDGWILVWPDAHVAWARQRREGLVEAVRTALGLIDEATFR